MSTKKTRILFTVALITKNGGSCAVLLNMINCMDLSKYDITLCSVFDTGIKPNVPKEVKVVYLFRVKSGLNEDIKKNSLGGKVLSKMYYLFRHLFPKQLFYNLKTRGKYDYEVAYDFNIQYKLVANSSRKCKKYAWGQVDITQEPKAREFYNSAKEEKRIISRFDKFLFGSNDAKNAFIETYGYGEKCQTIYNFNEISKIKKMAEDSIDVGEVHHPFMVTVGRLVYQKGYDRLLEAVKKIAEDGYSFEIWIIGDGEDEHKLNTYIQKNQLSNYVKLLGFQSNPYKYIVNCDWFIAPSRYEGFSTVVANSYILGVPVMATNCCGMSELTDGGRVGVLVNNDLDGVIEGLTTIITMNNNEYDSYVSKAKEWGEFFSVDARLKEVDELFKQ